MTTTPIAAAEVPPSDQSAAPPPGQADPTRPGGLTDAEAAARRAAGQGNTAAPPTTRTYSQIVRENVFTFINDVIFALGLLLVIVGRPVDAAVSLAVIGVNIVVSVTQETRAKRMLDRIALLTRPTAAVIRGGTERPAAPEELVIGDLVRVGAGDQVVLDGRLVDGSLEADESQLTGESDLIPKRRSDPVYSGSFVVNGGGTYEVTAVGSASLANRITAGARTFRRVLTPLQTEIHLVIRITLAIVVYFEVLLLANNLLKLVGAGATVGQAALVVGLVPNGLFVSIAIAYALGAVRIIRFGALVQQSNAIESLSNVTVLCVDKTGTLTANRLVVEAVVPFAGSEVRLAATVGAAVASAAVRNKTADAIAAAYPAAPRRLVADVPFSSARKWSAVAFAPEASTVATPLGGAEPSADGEASGATETFGGSEGIGRDERSGRDEASAGHEGPGRDEASGGTRPRGIVALGAAEFLRPYLALATDTPGSRPDSAGSGADGAPADWAVLRARMESFTSRGLRVLVVATHPDPTQLTGDGDAASLPDGMAVAGLVVLRDELRQDAASTLARFIAAGVTPKVISGDDPETVAALARQAGLGSDLRSVSGPDLEGMDDATLAAVAAETTVFGRITPALKERLVDALRSRGAYVAMVGDGVNDVLSLKKANLGIAMQSGSQAARGVADIVLTNDSFASLAPAVEEGQRIINGMQDILRLFLSRIMTVGLLIVTSLIIGLFPIDLRNGSALTLFTVGIPTAMLAVWAQPGARAHDSLARTLARFVIPASVLSSLAGLVVFYGSLILRLGMNVAIGTTSATDPAAFDAALQVAQSALTSFLVFAGLVLVVFVEPPFRVLAVIEPDSRDWRPTIMAVVLGAFFLGLMATPPGRAVFALHLVGRVEVALVLGAVVGWAILLALTWRYRIVERFLGI